MVDSLRWSVVLRYKGKGALILRIERMECGRRKGRMGPQGRWLPVIQRLGKIRRGHSPTELWLGVGFAIICCSWGRGVGNGGIAFRLKGSYGQLRAPSSRQ